MFTGFSPETFDFLWGIRFNNNREWFAQHKEQYQRSLYEPMKALVKDLEPDFLPVDGMKIQLSRIYRDMRMHPDTFYKDSLWFTLRHREDYWLENPCLCFELRPEGSRYGFLLLRPQPAHMEQLRKKMAEKPEEFLAMIRKAEKKSGIKLAGDRYKRPKPCQTEALTEFFTMKNFLALRDMPPEELLFSPALTGELRKVFHAWLPFYHFCRKTPEAKTSLDIK